MLDKYKLQQKLSKLLVNHSCKVQSGEKVLITYSDTPDEFIQILIEEIYKLDAIPIPFRLDKKIKRKLLLNANADTFEYFANIASPIMQSVDCVILIGGSNNDYELSDIKNDTMQLYSKLYIEPIHFKLRCSKKWVLLKYPTPAFAWSCNLSSEAFEKYFFEVCTLDYASLSNKLLPLKKLMESTDKVHILTPSTDLTFSIKNMPAIICSGECNIPDGEVYTAPIKNSINGQILFNIPAVENGVEYNNIMLKLKDGKIVDFDCNEKEKFKQILDTDEGSKFIGEFAFGTNPYCQKPIKDILFDEKMFGSIHLAIGSSYDDCYNGNKSAIHLDLIQSHKKEFGGGKIYFDEQLIFENGRFIYPNLVDLCEEKLI